MRFAPENGALTRWPDNVRIFELMAQYHFMPEDEANALTDAYVTMRDELHHLALQSLPSRVDINRFANARKRVLDSWDHYLGSKF